jgi:cytochrome P450
MTSLIKQEIIAKVGTSSDSPVKVDIEDWAGRVSLDIIGQAGFGSDFSALANPNTPLNTAYRGAFVPDGTSKLFFLLTLLMSPKVVSYLPFKKNKQIQDGVTAVTDFIKSLIDERKRQIYLNIDDLDCAKKASHRDIISVAMQSGAFTTPELIDQAKTLLGAGHETYVCPVLNPSILTLRSSAGALTFGIHLLSQPKHAHIQKKLREEIRANLPSPVTGIPIDADIIDRLPYLEAVSREAMRVYAPIPSIGRMAIVDTDICGTRVPKGTNVRVHPWAINKAKHLWGDDARDFKPERWLVGNDAANGGAETLAYMTFGHGPRGCIGRGKSCYYV